MSILAVYSNSTKKYVAHIVSRLRELEFSVDSVSVEQANERYYLEIYTTPVFFIVKSGIPAYPIQGIQNVDTIVNWAKNANIS